MKVSLPMETLLRLTLALTLLSSGLGHPSKHSRRAASSSNRIESEVVVRVPHREDSRESRVGEREVGAHCGNISRFYMSLYKLNGRSAATCNDGSEAGYYLLRQSNSNKWVIFLEGGWYCADETTCKLRKYREPTLTSSRHWFHCKTGEGIFSTSPRENPHLCDANMVYIPYCSSDLWTGTVRKRILGHMNSESFSFMGAIIVKQVVWKLIENHGMRDASAVILAGSSAGGTGVFMNVDRVQNLLTMAGSDAKVRGIVDSAWYLKRPRMNDENHCPNPLHCSPVTMLKMGVSLWQPILPRSCVTSNRRGRNRSPNSSRYFESRKDGTWKCFFGPVIYPYIEAEVFIVQWMFDKVQLQSDQVNLMSYHADTNRLLSYIKGLYEDLNESLTPVKAAFVSACYAHAVLDSSDWTTITVSQVSLPDAIQCWEVNLDTNDEETNDVTSDVSYNAVDTRRHHHYNQAELYNDVTDASNAEFASAELVPDDDDYRDNYYAINYLNDTPEPSTISPSQCRQKLIDPCPLPQCNPTCRTLYTPYFQNRINPIDFLGRLGIDLHVMAEKKGSNAAQLLQDLSRG